MSKCLPGITTQRTTLPLSVAFLLQGSRLKGPWKVLTLPWHMALSGSIPELRNSVLTRVEFSVASASAHHRQIPALVGTLTLEPPIRALLCSLFCQRPYEEFTFQLHEFPLQLLLHTLQFGLHVKYSVGQSRWFYTFVNKEIFFFTAGICWYKQKYLDKRKPTPT